MQILEFSEWDDAHGTCWLEQPEEFQDYLLADYVMDLRDDHGTGALQHARECVAALQKVFPRRRYTTASAVIAGWSAAQPPQQAPPMPQHLCYASVVLLFHLDQAGVGLCMLLCFVGLLRVGEALSLRTEDITLGSSEAIIHLHRTKRGQSECVCLTSIFVVRLIRSFIKTSGRSGTQLLCQVSYTRVRVWITRATAMLGFADIPFRSHSLRRGGATALFMQRFPLDNIMVYGRWASQSSCRMYLHTGEVAVIRLMRSPRKWDRVLALSRLACTLLSPEPYLTG